MEETILQTMRMMAWEKAKGEILAMMHTYRGQMDDYVAFKNKFESFVAYVESNGLHE